MKTGVFIGRCQPLHDGHRTIISKMVAETDHAFVLLGSANSARTLKNPWTFDEREAMILAEYPTVKCVPLNDYLYDDDRWTQGVVEEILTMRQFTNATEMVLYGHTKPDNKYLKWFKPCELTYVEVENINSLSATDIRNDLGERGLLPINAQLDFNFYKAEQLQFKDYPYPETLQFNCADALVMYCNNVLLIKRKHAPGIGKWALPGGFKNANETFQECAERELFEETGLNITEAGFFIQKQSFDSSRRTVGGIPRVTQCCLFALNDSNNKKLLETLNLQSSDDAAELSWVDMESALNYLDMFQDHRDIISKFMESYATPASLSHKGFIHATI